MDEPIMLKAAQYGISIQTIPFIKTEPTIDIDLREQILAASNRSLNVVFTSMNAVEAVAGCLPGVTDQWKIYCLGTATKKLVQLHFKDSLIAGTASNASLLADNIIDNQVESVVFFCGDQRRDELPEKLIKHNIQVDELAVYKTTAIPALVNKDYDGILFFSPSAAESFFSVNVVPDHTILFAIGTTTADCIRQFSTNTIVESDFPGKENLVEKAISYLDKSNKPNDPIKK